MEGRIQEGRVSWEDSSPHLAVDDGLGDGEHNGLADCAHVGRGVLPQLLQVVVKHLRAGVANSEEAVLGPVRAAHGCGMFWIT